jgi:hypothetical protein
LAVVAVNIDCCSFDLVDQIVIKQSSIDDLQVDDKISFVRLLATPYHLLDDLVE